MLIPFSCAKLWHVAPLRAATNRSKTEHAPVTICPGVLALIVAALGGGVMEAGLFLNRDASDAIVRARIILVWKTVRVLDELRMMAVVASLLVAGLFVERTDEKLALLQKE